jgi:type III pantothenate kinase
MLDYKTPNTLGLDRFLVCLAAWKESGEDNTIVVDAGSACTVDMMTKRGVYRGGVIMPGLPIIRHAMREKLPELPEVAESIPDEWPGKSTTECIEWGVNGGLMMAIHGFIDKYRNMVEEPSVYITGGNARKLLEWMGEKESMNYRKNLIWDGLEELARIAQK